MTAVEALLQEMLAFRATQTHAGELLPYEGPEEDPMNHARLAIIAAATVAVCGYVGSASADADATKVARKPPAQYVAQNPNRGDEEANPSEASMHFTATMDDEGAALGDQLRHLHGAEFKRVYLEHARHILKAQERAREWALGREPVIAEEQ